MRSVSHDNVRDNAKDKIASKEVVSGRCRPCVQRGHHWPYDANAAQNDSHHLQVPQLVKFLRHYIPELEERSQQATKDGARNPRLLKPVR